MAFLSPTPVSIVHQATSLQKCQVSTSTRMTSTETPRESKRATRRKIVNSDKFVRRGFKETKEAATKIMKDYYEADTFQEFKQQDNLLERGDITWKLAKAYGFCWGVERAVMQAFETAEKYPDKNIYLTNEIIHNPTVTDQLSRRGIKYIPTINGDTNQKDYSMITKDDVVILPAFGVGIEDMKYLWKNSHTIVDTTCPWVSRVWKQMDDHDLKNVTSIVHGKYYHEETVATVSFGTKYLIVKNYDEAQYVCDYIVNGGNREEFLDKFKNAISAGFNPDTDLRAVGIANQTTMLKSETTQIAKLFEKTMMKIHDPEEFKKSFVSTDTICDATQERQDAMKELLETGNLDMMIVVGGFNSSNTTQLQLMAETKGITSYWVDRPERVMAGNKIYARTAAGEERLIEDFMPKGKVTVGVTSGASSPDQVVEQVMGRINMVHAAL